MRSNLRLLAATLGIGLLLGAGVAIARGGELSGSPALLLLGALILCASAAAVRTRS